MIETHERKTAKERIVIPGLKNIKPSKVYDSTVQALKDYILESSLAAGDMLPTEMKLSEVLGISRSSIREALKSLEALGIINTVHGIGRFLREFNYDVMLENLSYKLVINVSDFKEIVDVRMALENAFIQKAMFLLSPDDFSELDSLVRRMEENIAGQGPESDLVQIHTKFHLCLYARLENKLLNNLIDAFATFQRYLVIRNNYHTRNMEEFIENHISLLEKLKEKDSEGVSLCVKEHFSDVTNWIETHKDGVI
jgi:GntR family transcriptional repressor for pyruvate dehydrogenase complex